MSTAIIFVPVLVGLVSFYVSQKQLSKKNRLLRKMYDSQVKFLKYQVRKLEAERNDLKAKSDSFEESNKELTERLAQKNHRIYIESSKEELALQLKELSDLKKMQSVLQRRLDSDVVSLQEKDELVLNLQNRIKELEAAYWAQKDESQTYQQVLEKKSAQAIK